MWEQLSTGMGDGKGGWLYKPDQGYGDGLCILCMVHFEPHHFLCFASYRTEPPGSLHNHTITHPHGGIL